VVIFINHMDIDQMKSSFIEVDFLINRFTRHRNLLNIEPSKGLL